MRSAEKLELQKRLYSDIRLYGKVEAVQQLISLGMDLDLAVGEMANFPYTALMCAVESEQLALCTMLLDAGANSNVSGYYDRSPLHLAGFHDRDARISRLLIERGADVHRRDVYGSTALHHAAGKGFLPTMAHLLAEGARVGEANEVGMTPLHEAADNRSTDACRLLLDAGAVIDAQSYLRETPLHRAARANRPELCRFLVERGADPSRVPMGVAKGHAASYCLTPFQEAVNAGAVDVVRFFVMECGQDLAQRTASNRTLAQLAAKHPKMRDALKYLRTELAIAEVMPSAEVQVQPKAPRLTSAL